MIEYRKPPKGNELIGKLGLGMGGIQNTTPDEIEAVIREAVANEINLFDLRAGGASVYAPFGKAIMNVHEKVFFQLHFGAVYNADGEYGWSRDLETIRRTFGWEMKTPDTDYVDFGFLRCAGTDSDIEDIMKKDIFDYVRELKSKGIIRHIGFSSHTPSVANRLIDTGLIDMMMFSINPAYDLERGDKMAHDHYSKLTVRAYNCISCGHCTSRCPFDAD